jgi:rubrerythrin
MDHGPFLAITIHEQEGSMSLHTLDAEMSREQLLGEVVAAEREARDVLERAASVASDPAERELFERLARREDKALDELGDEERRLEAEVFVQRAIGC